MSDQVTARPAHKGAAGDRCAPANKVISARITEEQLVVLTKTAQQMGCSVSALLRWLVESLPNPPTPLPVDGGGITVSGPPGATWWLQVAPPRWMLPAPSAPNLGG